MNELNPTVQGKNQLGYPGPDSHFTLTLLWTDFEFPQRPEWTKCAFCEWPSFLILTLRYTRNLLIINTVILKMPL